VIRADAPARESDVAEKRFGAVMGERMRGDLNERRLDRQSSVATMKGVSASEQTQALVVAVCLLVALFAQEKTVGQFLTSAGTDRLLVVELRAPSLARAVVGAGVVRALADAPRA
jgi:hypothetical protein